MFISITAPATTADCKQLLALKDPAKRWSRVTKFKQGSAWFRIFKDELASQYAVVVEGQTYLTLTAVADSLERAKTACGLPTYYRLSPSAGNFKEEMDELQSQGNNDDDELYALVAGYSDPVAVANHFKVTMPSVNDVSMEGNHQDFQLDNLSSWIDDAVWSFTDKHGYFPSDSPNGLEVLFQGSLESPNESDIHYIDAGANFNEKVDWLLANGFELSWDTDLEIHPVMYIAMAQYMLAKKPTL